MSNPFVPIETADLIWKDELPFSLQFEDIYYSREGGLEQSRYVFIDGNHLIDRWTKLPHDGPSNFTIAETGFGLGLNFLLTLQLWEQHAPQDSALHFISCDKHPLKSDDLARCHLNWPQLKSYSSLLLKNYPVLTPGFHHISFLEGRVRLTLMLGDAYECFEQLLICGESRLENKLRTTHVDAWFFDGFSPKKNQEMWSNKLIQIAALLSRKGTTLATYSAAEPIKSALTEYGFSIEKKKGFGPKRHMISACLSEQKNHHLKTRHTPWHISEPIGTEEKKVAVIGAGLAGCLTAYSLAIRGWEVTLIDQANSLAEGASANQQAVLFPVLSAYRSPLSQFMLAAFLYASRFYQTFIEEFNLGEMNGSLLMAHNEKENKMQQSLRDWFCHYPQLGQLVDAQRASEFAGLPLDLPGLFIPLSGWINSPALCHAVSRVPGIRIKTNSEVKELVFQNGFWQVNEEPYCVVILSNGFKMNQFSQTSDLPLKAIKGQMTSINSSAVSCSLKIPLSGDGHVLPAINNQHLLGATYHLGNDNADTDTYDDVININKLQKMVPKVSWDQEEIVSHWAGIRASTPDYLPMVGPVPKTKEFKNLYRALESNSKRWIASSGIYYPGLYVAAGFGSRGLTTIPLCAEYLAATINNEWVSLPRNLIQSIAPARFLRKEIIRGFG